MFRIPCQIQYGLKIPKLDADYQAVAMSFRSNLFQAKIYTNPLCQEWVQSNFSKEFAHGKKRTGNISVNSCSIQGHGQAHAVQPSYIHRPNAREPLAGCIGCGGTWVCLMAFGMHQYHVLISRAFGMQRMSGS